MEVALLVFAMSAVAFTALKIGKIVPQEMALVPLVIMLIMDGMLVFAFKEVTQMANKHIAFSVMAATFVKVIALTLSLPKLPNND